MTPYWCTWCKAPATRLVTILASSSNNLCLGIGNSISYRGGKTSGDSNDADNGASNGNGKLPRLRVRDRVGVRPRAILGFRVALSSEKLAVGRP